MRIAVVGLYNSGSTAIAEMLHLLGVYMGGPPFWHPQDSHFEPYELSFHLRRWWDEPHIVETVSRDERVAYLGKWIELQECSSSIVGAKHPLLSLCGPDLREAWGDETLFIWSYRSLGESIEGVRRRGWFSGYEESLQRSLWNALHEFESSGARIEKINWAQAKSDPAWAARELVAITGITTESERIEAAAASIKPHVAPEPPPGLARRIKRRLGALMGA